MPRRAPTRSSSFARLSLAAFALTAGCAGPKPWSVEVENASGVVVPSVDVQVQESRVEFAHGGLSGHGGHVQDVRAGDTIVFTGQVRGDPVVSIEIAWTNGAPAKVLRLEGLSTSSRVFHVRLTPEHGLEIEGGGE